MAETDQTAARAEKFDGIQDAIEEVHYRFHMYTETPDMVNRAHHLMELANAVSDLASWHDSHDTNDGLLGWQREDADQ